MGRGRVRWTEAIAITLLCVLSVAFYRHIVLSNRILSGGDAFTYFYPYRAHAARQVCRGHIPLWNPYLFTGVPFLANPQAAVFYPLNAALCWLSAPKLMAWSITIHVALAAVWAYLYGRHSLRLAPLPAFLAASVFAFGGFLSGQVEHLNQLNVSAWFPLLLLLWDLRQRARRLALLGLGTAIGIGLLAGHTQSSYISLFGLGVYALIPALFPTRSTASPLKKSGRNVTGLAWSSAKAIGRTIFDLARACLLGVALAAVQILPSLELARMSIRSGGLSYQETVAFSLVPLPRLLRYTFLPPWGADLAQVFGGSHFTEYVAYVGIVPLVLVALWIALSLLGCRGVLVRGVGGWGKPSLHEVQLLVLGALGIALALGRFNPLYWILYKAIPGFGLFRVPARWLFLYAFGVAMLAGIATQRVGAWIAARLRPVTPLPWDRLLPAGRTAVVAVALVELFMASDALPLSHPTAPEAFSSLRTAPSHILAAQGQTIAPGRFLSLSDMLYDPGDLNEMRQMFEGQLSEQEIYDYIVCAKRKEIIAPNLPLAWQMYAVDGYDGGLLPLQRYVLLQRLFLEPEDILPDGRLREGLERIPPSRLLSLLGARYAITDKVNDVWIDDVFYDLAFDAVLGADAVPSIASTDPEFTATGLGVVSFLEGARVVADGTPVAEVRVTTKESEVLSFTLHAGRDTAYHTGGALGAEYTARLDWGRAAQVARVEVVALPFGGRIHVRGLALIDGRDGSNVPLILSTDGQYRQVHSGDVKIYEVLDALPRAYAVHRTRIVENDEAALAALSDTALDPEHVAILSSGKALDEKPATAPQVTVHAYEPEQVVIQASLRAPGYLVLSDAWYPGWRASVNGQWTTIERANVHFRAVYLDAGTHTVCFIYRPTSYWVGVAISALACIFIGWRVLFSFATRNSNSTGGALQ